MGWPLGLALIACAAWQPIRRLEGVRDEGWQTLTLPTFFALVGLSLLVYDHFVRINTLAMALASATIAAVIVRAVLTFRERVHLLAASREEALTDALTGLGNRRRFMLEFDAALADERAPFALVVFDLDGFKAYNDSFGHSAGDALLARVAGRLGAAVDGEGRAYRLGGDEFCVLAGVENGESNDLAERAAAALTEEGEGFAVSCSYGAVLMPSEASQLSEALSMADHRMYLHKQRHRAPVETVDALGAVRDAESRIADVAELAEAVARRLRVSPDELSRDPAGGRAARRRQARDPGGDPEQAGLAQRRRVGVREAAPADRRADPRGRTRLRRRREARPLQPRALGRNRLPGSADRPRDPAGRADHLGLRRVRCDDHHASVRAANSARRMRCSELVRCAGTQFDPEVVAAFASVQLDLHTELVA